MKVHFSENENSFSFVNNKWRSQKDAKRMKNTKKTPHSNDIVFLTNVRLFNDELLFHHIQNEKLMRKKLHKTTTDEHIFERKFIANAWKCDIVRLQRTLPAWWRQQFKCFVIWIEVFVEILMRSTVAKGSTRISP